MRRALPLGAQINLLLLLVIVPLLGTLGYQYWSDVTLARENTGEQLRLVARAVAADTNSDLADAQDLLGLMARRPLIRAVDAARCDPFLEQFAQLHPDWANVGVVNLAGRLVCSAERYRGSKLFAIEDRSLFFDQVLRTGRPVVSRPFVGPLSKRWVVVMAQPIRDDAGAVQGRADRRPRPGQAAPAERRARPRTERHDRRVRSFRHGNHALDRLRTLDRQVARRREPRGGRDPGAGGRRHAERRGPGRHPRRVRLCHDRAHRVAGRGRQAARGGVRAGQRERAAPGGARAAGGRRDARRGPAVRRAHAPLDRPRHRGGGRHPPRRLQGAPAAGWPGRDRAPGGRLQPHARRPDPGGRRAAQGEPHPRHAERVQQGADPGAKRAGAARANVPHRGRPGRLQPGVGRLRAGRPGQARARSRARGPGRRLRGRHRGELGRRRRGPRALRARDPRAPAGHRARHRQRPEFRALEGGRQTPTSSGSAPASRWSPAGRRSARSTFTRAIRTLSARKTPPC